MESLYDVGPKEISILISKVLNEKLNLSIAIANAKPNMNIIVGCVEYPFDTAIEYTKSLQQVARGFYRDLKGYKSSSIERTGFDYTFNVEGNQTQFQYPLEIITDLKFNQADFNLEEKKLKKLSNLISIEIEEMSSRKMIEFETEFDYLEQFNEIMQKIADSK